MISTLTEDTVTQIREAILFASAEKQLNNLSKEIGISDRGITKIGNGETKNPGYFSLMKIQGWLLLNLPSSLEHTERSEFK